MDMNMTFPSDTGELVVHIGDSRISLNVYEGKTAAFEKKDAVKILKTITRIIEED